MSLLIDIVSEFTIKLIKFKGKMWRVHNGRHNATNNVLICPWSRTQTRLISNTGLFPGRVEHAARSSK